MMSLLTLALWAMTLVTAALGAEVVPRATFTEVTDYGSNPTGTRMWLYVPRNLAAKPAVVVGIHWCSGSAQAYYQGSLWATNAEKYGYIVIYPQTPYTRDNCWDVASKMTLTHGGGGASNSIANMVSFVIAQYGADKGRVFATGISSGAMMTNVLAATYPDVFAAGIAYAGVPAGCFMSADDIPDFWNSTCSTGQSIWTQQQWANVVKEMYPGYTGARPKMQIYHGSADEALNVQNYYETIKQWTGVFGYSTTPVSETPNYPRSPYTKYVFGDKLQTFLGAGVTHSIDVFPEEDLKWFGFVRNSRSGANDPILILMVDTSELLGLSDDSRNNESRVDDAGGQQDNDGWSHDDFGGRWIGDGAAVGPMRRHQLDGTDGGTLGRNGNVC
ncbi:PHB depolymerase family esterase [Colletotrichum tofieldiae]|nr:PHB depolymerase family esterase [Colletotrichum tofieldiae]GKT79149.1 PHB depolymerase family esterase [Colletotrichum tofieldiae]